jgi:ABC-type oligopeptide transport system substrate-binding subunit
LTRRHSWIAIALVVLFAAMATSAANAARQGGTIRIDLRNDVDYTDPALSYYAPGWELEYATQLKLMNYPDANGPRSSQLQPEAAAAFPKVSNNGRVYDFTVNAGFTKFSTGQPVTAASFKAAFDRIADPKMQSPAIAFMSDIAGGDKSPVSGVVARGNHLVITLKQAAPDFLARVAMPFFSAIPTNLAHDPNGVDTPPSAGPYYVAERTPNKSIVVKRNPYYKGKRPHNAAQFVYTVGNSLEAIRLRVEQGDSDYAADGIPPSAWAEVAQKYGVNKSQFYVKPQLAVSYLAFNTTRPIFRNNAGLRKAINYAIDRPALLRQSGFLAGKRTDQILPPGLAGFRDASLYPIKGPDLKTAEKWSKGNTRDGKIVVYTCNSGPCPLRGQILQFNLKQIGLDVEVRQFARAVQIQKEGTRGEPFDIADEGWVADYADPYDFVNVLLDGKNIKESNNNNYSYFNDPKYNQKMAAAALLTGNQRYEAYGALDIDLMKNAVPWAARSNANLRLFVSKNFGCFTYSNIYGNNLAGSCVK